MSDLQAAVKVLKRSERGRRTLKYLNTWLNDCGALLDQQGQEAVVELLEGVWGPIRGTSLDLLRDAAEVEVPIE